MRIQCCHVNSLSFSSVNMHNQHAYIRTKTSSLANYVSSSLRTSLWNRYQDHQMLTSKYAFICHVTLLSLLPTQHLWVRTQVEVLKLHVSFSPQQISKSPYQTKHDKLRSPFSPLFPGKEHIHATRPNLDSRSPCLFSVAKTAYIRCIRTTIQDHHVSPSRANLKSMYQKTQLAFHVCSVPRATHQNYIPGVPCLLFCPTCTTNTHISELKRLRAGLRFFVSLGGFNSPYQDGPVVLLCQFFPIGWTSLNPLYENYTTHLSCLSGPLSPGKSQTVLPKRHINPLMPVLSLSLPAKEHKKRIYAMHRNRTQKASCLFFCPRPKMV